MSLSLERFPILVIPARIGIAHASYLPSPVVEKPQQSDEPEEAD
jgi:hypothetical protein